jgi:hypothetical protein
VYLLHALPYYLYKESYENLVLTSDSLAVVLVHDRALEQLTKHMFGGTSSVTAQRTAQGRVTSDYPTIELCDRARSFTGGRCTSRDANRSLLHLPRCNCPLVHTLVTLASQKGLSTLLVLGDVLHGTSEYY